MSRLPAIVGSEHYTRVGLVICGTCWSLDSQWAPIVIAVILQRLVPLMPGAHQWRPHRSIQCTPSCHPLIGASFIPTTLSDITLYQSGLYIVFKVYTASRCWNWCRYPRLVTAIFASKISPSGEQKVVTVRTRSLRSSRG